MNKLIFRLLAFIYIALVTFNFIDKRDWHYLLGIDDGSIVVKSEIVPDIETIKITPLSGPLIYVAHVNPNNHNQLIINGNQQYLSLDHGLTWSEIKLDKKIYSATWVNNTILISTGNFKGKTLMASEDFGVSWNPVTINTDSDEPIMLPEISENFGLSWKSTPLSSLDEKVLSDIDLILNRQGSPILQFSEESKYNFELNDNELYIKEKYKDTAAQPTIYQDNIQFMHGEIPAVLSVSIDGLWAATLGGIFFKKHNDTNWQDKSASLGAHSFDTGFESQQGNKLLVLDKVGRLVISEDKGKSWKPLADNVSKAKFLKDESVVIVQQSGRVILIDGDDTFEIAPDWKLIQNEKPEATLSSLYENYIYFIHGDKDGIWLTTGPAAYIQENPIEISHYDAITQSLGSIYKVIVYHYNRNEKQWKVKPWSSTSEKEYAIDDRCELSINYDNIVSINGHRTSDYGTSEKVMLIQSGNKYAYFDDSEVYIRNLKNCEPSGVKKVWDFDEILNPAAYYETAEGLEVVCLSYHNNTIKRIHINLNDTPPLWRWFFYFFYYQYGLYILGIGLIIWFLNIRRKKPMMQV